MSDPVTVETAEMQRREAMATRPQDQFVGRGKFSCCLMCGSDDGMQATPREVLTLLSEGIMALLAPWYSEPGSECLFHACNACNRQGVIPAGYVRMWLADIPAWIAASGRDNQQGGEDG